MKRFFSEMFKPFKEGLKDGATTNPGEEQAEWQRRMSNLWSKLADETVSDEDIVEDYFDFLGRNPEKRLLENVKEFLDQMMAKRPGTISIIRRNVDQAEQMDNNK